MKRRAAMLACGLALAAGAVLWAQEDDLAKRETAVRAALMDFWTASVRGDARSLHERVGFPLTLLEQQDPAQPTQPPYVVLEADWPAFAAGMPAVPFMEREVTATFRNLRLEWLDPLTCLATYDLAVTTPDEEWEGHFASVARYHDEGWRIFVSSIPG